MLKFGEYIAAARKFGKNAKRRALSVKIFLQVHFIGKTKLHGGA